MSGFADTTTVPAERTRAEIESLLKKYNADSFASGWNDREAFVAFRAHDRMVRFKIALPDPKDRKFTHRDAHYRRSDVQTEALYEQAIRTIWRRLLLCIKAKLESVASGIEQFETAFAAHILLPNGQTVGEWVGPQVAAAYQNGAMPKSLMPGPQPIKPELNGVGPVVVNPG